MLKSEEFLSQFGRIGSEFMPSKYGVIGQPRHQEKLALVLLKRQAFNVPHKVDKGVI